MKTTLIAAAIAVPMVTAVAVQTAAAQSGSVLSRRVGADLSVGTLGVNANVQVGLHDRVALRGGAQWAEVSVNDREESGVTYDTDLTSTGVAGFVDLHPFANGFTVTGGLFYGDRSADLDATPNEDVTLGGRTFSPEQVGLVTGEAEFDDAALFAGLGYDDTLYGDGRWSFVARAGIMFLGEPDVTLDAERLADDPTGELRPALDAEARELEDEIADYAYYPVVTVGLSYGF